MNGNFGVFDYTELLAEFGDDKSADEFRSDLKDSGYVPVYEDELTVAEIPENYRLWQRLLEGLRRSRDRDVRLAQALSLTEAVRSAA